MKLWILTGLLMVPCFIGCSDSEFVGIPLPEDAGADAKPDVQDAGKDAEDAADAAPDATQDASMDALPEAGLEAGPDAESDAPPDVAIDGAVTLTPGDLIKGSLPAVYYYGQDAQRHTFPNENTFNSWFTADDLNLVKTIPDEQLASIPPGKNITIRPGTYLVKITSDPKTYAITNCGQLHWIESEAIITALYGPNWATLIVDVPDTLFGDYTPSTAITAPIHPDGQLVSYAGDPNRYVVMSSQKRKIASEAAFNANHWQAKFVVQTTVPYGNGPDVTSSEPENFWKPVCP